MPTLDRPISVLVLASHPSDRPMPNHATAEAFCEALESQGEQLRLEWLWPANLAGLAARLGNTSKPGIGLLVLLSPLTASELWLEDEQGLAQRLTLNTLAELLRQTQIPLVILPDTAAEPGILEQLAEQARTSIVSYEPAIPPDVLQSVLTAFLSAALAGQPLDAALGQPGATLATDRETASLHLAGATQPAFTSLPGRSLGISKVVRFPTASVQAPWRLLPLEPALGGLTAEPGASWMGRDKQIATLERGLRPTRSSAPLWVYGSPGVGKTALLAHVARWLVRTGRFARVVRTDWSAGGFAEEALYDLAHNVAGDGRRAEEMLKSGDPVGAVALALSEAPTLIIWDHVDTLLTEGPYKLEPAGRAGLKTLAAVFGGVGTSRLVLVSDTAELPPAAGEIAEVGQQLHVDALAEADAVAFWQAAAAQAHRPSDTPQAIAALLSRIGSHPLTLSVLAHLPGHPALGEIETGLAELLPDYMAGEALLRQQGLEAAIELHVRRLGDTVRETLLPLGLYRRGFMQPLALRLLNLDERLWEQAKQSLQPAGLLEEQRLPGYNVPYVRFHPAFSTYLDRRLAGPQRAALSEEYTSSYVGLTSWLAQAEERSPEVVRLLFRRELPNLRETMRLLLRQQKLELASAYAAPLLRFLQTLGLTSESEQVGRSLERATRQALPEEGPFSRSGVRLLLTQADRMMAAGQLPQASTLLQNLLKALTVEKGITYAGDEAAIDRSQALQKMARLVRGAGRLDVAITTFSQAIEQVQELALSDGVRRQRLSLYDDLSATYMAASQGQPAEEMCTRGLDLAGQLGDVALQGSLESRLAALAMARRDPAAAQIHWDAALQHFTALQDLKQMAMIWQSRGSSALRTRDLAEARRCLDQALPLCREADDPALEAQLYLQLAQVAQQDGRLEDAEAHLGQALAIYQKHRVVAGQASAETSLAQLLLSQGRLDQARVHAEAARVLTESPQKHDAPWELYALLQSIVQAQGDAAEAARWRGYSQEAFAASSAAEVVRQQWAALIHAVSTAARGSALDAEAAQTLERLDHDPRWKHLAGAIWRILDGERDAILWKGLDAVDALVVRAMVDAIEHPLDEAPGGGDQASA